MCVCICVCVCVCVRQPETHYPAHSPVLCLSAWLKEGPVLTGGGLTAEAWGVQCQSWNRGDALFSVSPGPRRCTHWTGLSDTCVVSPSLEWHQTARERPVVSAGGGAKLSCGAFLGLFWQEFWMTSDVSEEWQRAQLYLWRIGHVSVCDVVMVNRCYWWGWSWSYAACCEVTASQPNWSAIRISLSLTGPVFVQLQRIWAQFLIDLSVLGVRPLPITSYRGLKCICIYK